MPGIGGAVPSGAAVMPMAITGLRSWYSDSCRGGERGKRARWGVGERALLPPLALAWWGKTSQPVSGLGRVRGGVPLASRPLPGERLRRRGGDLGLRSRSRSRSRSLSRSRSRSRSRSLSRSRSRRGDLSRLSLSRWSRDLPPSAEGGGCRQKETRFGNNRQLSPQSGLYHGSEDMPMCPMGARVGSEAIPGAWKKRVPAEKERARTYRQAKAVVPPLP